MRVSTISMGIAALSGLGLGAASPLEKPNTSPNPEKRIFVWACLAACEIVCAEIGELFCLACVAACLNVVEGGEPIEGVDVILQQAEREGGLDTEALKASMKHANEEGKLEDANAIEAYFMQALDKGNEAQ